MLRNARRHQETVALRNEWRRAGVRAALLMFPLALAALGAPSAHGGEGVEGSPENPYLLIGIDALGDGEMAVSPDTGTDCPGTVCGTCACPGAATTVSPAGESGV